MEIVPRSLAENAGLDPIDKLTNLRADHDNKESKSGFRYYQIDFEQIEAEDNFTVEESSHPEPATDEELDVKARNHRICSASAHRLYYEK